MLLTPARIRLALVASLVIGCAPTPVSKHSAPPNPEPKPAPPPPTSVVFQPVYRVPCNASPEQQVRFNESNYLTLFKEQDPGQDVDAGQPIAFASLPLTNFFAKQVLLTPDRRDAILLLGDRRSANEGKLLGPSWDQRDRYVERWNLSTRKRIWSTRIPVSPDERKIEFGSRGIIATRCFIAKPGQTDCEVLTIDENTGALGPMERQTNVKVNSPAVVNKAPIPCDQNRAYRGKEWFESTYYWIGAGRRIAWLSRRARFTVSPFSRFDEPAPMAYMMDAERKGLPTALPLPAETDAPTLGLSGSGSRIYANSGDASKPRKVFRLEDSAFVPDSTLAESGLLLTHGDSDVFLLQDNKHHRNDYPVLLLGTRKPSDDGWTWQKTAVTSQFYPQSVRFEVEGRPQAIIVGGRFGLQRIDLRTGALINRICALGTLPSGFCGTKDTSESYYGILGPTARQTFFTTHHTNRGGAVTNSFDEIEISTGKTIRSFPGPFWATNLPLDMPMGWVEQDRKFWVDGATDTGVPCTAIVTLPKEESGAPYYEFSCRQAPINTFAADPKGKYFAAPREYDTVDIFTPSGKLVLTMGVRGGSGFAQTVDGRFACEGQACDEFRCIVGETAHRVTDPACASWRTEGFSVLEEVARMQ